MTGVLSGIRVLDLSWGLSGPMTAMLLADHGADVIKIEPPGGDPFRKKVSGYQVWGRGKRSAIVNLKKPAERDRFYELVDTADVLIESYSPGVTKKLGIDYDTLHARNPSLIYCSITGYGTQGKHIDRPAIDALVSARTGHHWEIRGVEGTTMSRLAGKPGVMPGLEAPEGCWVGAERDGPLFAGIPWVSLTAFYCATLAISAAIRARGITGKGQHVHTSLMQGVICSTLGGWIRAENVEAPYFQTWITDPRAPKSFFKCKDGVWTHHWTPLPSFVLGVSEGDTLELNDEVTGPRQAQMRIGMHPDDMVLLHHYTPLLAERVAKFDSADWVRIAAQVGAPVQPVRPPEAALVDPLLLSDGCVTEVVDPALGPVRQVGQVYRLTECPNEIGGAPAGPGEHTDEVFAEIDAVRARRPSIAPTGAELSAPLDGIVVLDLGLAVAGPFGTQCLADLGATVIKVNTFNDEYWMSNHIAMCCNRGKRSIAINLKEAAGLALLHKLVEKADIVQHNMRYDAARRLKVDYDSLKLVKPDLIYCHTRGFERSEREALPGNDQTGAALAGSEWMDGGLDHGGNPVWSVTSLGDTGNGFLSAIAMTQALWYRDRTGKGQFVDTSIIYAHLLNNSMAWLTPDGRHKAQRQSLDKMQLGWSALYREYRCANDTWLVIAATEDRDWKRLKQTLDRPDLKRDKKLWDKLEAIFAEREANDWFALLDGAGVPCEVSSPDFVLGLFDDPEFIDKGWVTKYRHPVVGQMECMGLLFDLSDTPGRIMGPPFMPGQHTREILGELGYTPTQIDELSGAKVVLERD